MGNSSSQPVPAPTPSRVANASMVASPATEPKSHFTHPNMDDAAAAQQLMDEGTRAAAHATNGVDASVPVQKKRKRNSAHKFAKKNTTAPSPPATQALLAQSSVPESSPFPFPATQLDTESPAANVFAHSTTVEVPDSQVAVPHAHAPAPISSPISSHAVPSSATKGKRTYKKSKQTKRDRIVRDAVQDEGIDLEGDATMGADVAASPLHTPSKPKPSQVDDTESGLHEETEVALQDVHSRNAATKAVDGAPTPAKRRKIGRPKLATTVKDLVQDALNPDGDDEDGDQLSHTEKKKLKRIKKPQTPVTKTKNIYEIPDDDPRPMNGENGKANGDLQHNDRSDLEVASTTNRFARPAHAGEDIADKTSTRKLRGSSNKTNRTGKDEVYEWAAPVRTPGQPLGEEDENSIMREPISSDEDYESGRSPDNDHRSKLEKKKKKKRRSSGTSKKKVTPRRESCKFNYTRKVTRTGTAAERALNADHELNHPPDLRSSGDFTKDEEELIRRAIQDYQQRKGLEVSDLVEIIQWNAHDPGFNRADGTVAGKNDWTPQDAEDARESAEFWEEIRHINMKRSLDRLRRHIRQTYHQFKSGAWTDEEDERLKSLYAMHPNKWKVISVGMGDRSMHDCQNRWRDYLQYGDKLKSSRWEPEEEELFIHAIRTVAQRDEEYRAESGLPPLDAYTTKDINWQQVSREMGNTRSRIQAVAKWRNLLKRNPPPHIQVEHRPRKNKARVDKSAPSAPTPRKRGRPPKGEGETPKQRRNAKSQEVIDNSDDDKLGQPEKSESSVVKKSKNFRMTETEDIVDKSDEEGRTSKDSHSSSSKKKRKVSRMSKDAEVEKPKKPRPTNIRDDIENSDDEGVHRDQETNSSPPVKKRGRPRKSNDVKADDAKKHRKSKVSQESVKDLMLVDDESEHAESSDKLMDDMQPDPVEDVKGDERQEDDDDVAQKGDEDLSSAGSHSGTPGREEVQNENEEASEHGEDQLSVTSDSPAVGTSDSHLEDNNAAAQKEMEESCSEENNRLSVTSDNAVKKKPTVSDAAKMQWGDLFDLIAKLQERRDEEEADIDWEGVAEEVATHRNYMWSPQALRTALEEMIQLLRDNDKEVDVDDLPGTVDDIMDFISAEHGAEIEEYYDLS